MTDRDRELLEVLAGQDGFKSVPVLQYYHPQLRQYSKHQLFASAAVLIKAALALRTVASIEREARYRISDDGLAMVQSGNQLRH